MLGSVESVLIVQVFEVGPGVETSSEEQFSVLELDKISVVALVKRPVAVCHKDLRPVGHNADCWVD